MNKLFLLPIILLSLLSASAQPDTIRVRIQCAHGDIALEEKKYPEALKIFENCLQKYIPIPEAQLGAAKAAYYLGNYGQAFNYITDVLNTEKSSFRNSPDFREAYRVAALIEDKLTSGQLKADTNMVLVKGGTYTIGCKPGRDKDCEDQESPAHTVTVGDFYISKYEVTQQEWMAVMGNNPSGFTNCKDCPVENVSWDDVQEFLEKLNARSPGTTYRLPTEAEWEYASRGGSKSKGFVYSGGNQAEEVGWINTNSENKTHPVGKKSPNELGLFDMSGNVWEWCSDWFGKFTAEAQNNPKGPATGPSKSNRGGCWQYTAKYARPSYRCGLNSVERNNDLGFRLAKSVQ